MDRFQSRREPASSLPSWPPMASTVPPTRMSSLPPLAANAVSDLLTANIKRPDGQDATAFKQQRDALVAMREMVMAQQERIAALEGRLNSLPFPWRDRSTPPG